MGIISRIYQKKTGCSSSGDRFIHHILTSPFVLISRIDCTAALSLCFILGGCLCVGQGVNSVLEEDHSYGPVILRRKRAVGKEKNTCQLFIQTDHLFFRYYGTREAVISQVRGALTLIQSWSVCFLISWFFPCNKPSG